MPSAVVLVATVRALKHHGGDPEGGYETLERGGANLERHLQIVGRFGLKAVVAVNAFPGDRNGELEAVRRLALDGGAYAAAINDAFARGGEGAAELAEAVVDAASQQNSFDYLYPLDAPIPVKIETIATRVYGADTVHYLPSAEEKLERFAREGLDQLPICMAKTHLSLSDDPTLLNAPSGFTLHVRDIRAYTGAGWLVPLCGEVMTMPGLGKTAAAFDVDIDEHGRTVGLF